MWCGADPYEAKPLKYRRKSRRLPSTIAIMFKVDGGAKKQLSAKKVAETLKKGAISKITTEEMFHGIMTQKFET
jgi:hypothetical protein